LKIRYYIIFVIFYSLLQGCKKENSTPQTNYQSGVVISFDDDFVEEWFKVNDTLLPFDWKATFFVTQFQKFEPDKLQKIKRLKELGHEIGGHGFMHLNAQTFCSKFGTNEYLNQEISPMLVAMNKEDIFPTSFAYPFGARNPEVDNELLKKFEMIRGTTYGNANPANQKCYFNNNRLVFGLGLDNHYSHFSIPYFISLLKYAKDKNKIVVFYAHKPVPIFQNKYETEYKTLIEICRYVKNNKMKFYKMSELDHLLNNN